MRYGWCEIDGGAADHMLSGLMQQPKGTSDDAYERAFAQAIGQNLDQGHRCWFYYSSPTEAQSYFKQRQYVIESNEKKSFKLTGWVGPYGINGEPAPESSGAYLTIEDSGGKAAGDQLRDAVLRAQRDEAAARARVIANTARQRADMQAKLDRYFEEMRKRGSAQ
jgi:hypothetical protein